MFDSEVMQDVDYRESGNRLECGIEGMSSSPNDNYRCQHVALGEYSVPPEVDKGERPEVVEPGDDGGNLL